MDTAALRPDCDRCAALCCVALAFDRGPMFAIDKANGEPCPNLGAGNGCRIYADRAKLGFPGCIAFDCLGAGQRVTQDLFGGRSWRDDPALLAPMGRAFEAMRRLHETAQLLAEAAKLPLPPAERDSLTALAGEIWPAGGWSVATFSAAAADDIGVRAREFLRGLRVYLDKSGGDQPSTAAPVARS